MGTRLISKERLRLISCGVRRKAEEYSRAGAAESVPADRPVPGGLKQMLVVGDGERRIVGRRAGVMGTVDVGGVVSVRMRIVSGGCCWGV